VKKSGIGTGFFSHRLFRFSTVIYHTTNAPYSLIGRLDQIQ